MADARRLNALRDLAKKMRLEAFVKNDLRKIFKKISNEMRASFSRNGRVIKVSDFQNEMKALLEKHHRKVMKDFNKNIRDSMGKGLKLLKQDEDEEVESSNEAFLLAFPLFRAKQILETTQTNLNESISQAIDELSTEDGQPLPNDIVAAEAANNFTKKTNPRIDMIAITETQAPAERTKENEMNALITAGVISAFASRKTWTAILDERVRDNHAIADGQSQRIGNPFSVGGELLRHPGDTSLGASAGNVINCRCSSSLTVL